MLRICCLCFLSVDSLLRKIFLTDITLGFKSMLHYTVLTFVRGSRLNVAGSFDGNLMFDENISAAFTVMHHGLSSDHATFLLMLTHPPVQVDASPT